MRDSGLVRNGIWQEEIERRLEAPDNRNGFVELEFGVTASRVQIRIWDQGPGFDWVPYLDLDPSRAFDPHGRGIAMARLSSFDDLEYVNPGNQVIATVSKSFNA